MAELFESRNAVYGNDYQKSGQAFAALFPDGITLKNPEDFVRFALFVHIHGKLGRYATNLARGKNHSDSLNDLSVYSQMLRTFDDDRNGGA